jgi:hypothetical protein
MTEPSSFQAIVAVANGILSIVACLLLVAVVVAVLLGWRALRRTWTNLTIVQRDFAPVLTTMERVVGNLEGLTATMRSDIEAIHGTIQEATGGVQAVVRIAGDRLQRLDSVVGATQDEVEAALVDVVAAARGLRAGAVALRGVLGLTERTSRRAPRRSNESSDEATRAAVPSEPDGRTDGIDGGNLDDGTPDRAQLGGNRPRPRVRSRRGKA